MVQSFEQKVIKLQADIRDREKQLQFIEDVNNKEPMPRFRPIDLKFLGSI
jgi:hypothetical protein